MTCRLTGVLVCQSVVRLIEGGRAKAFACYGETTLNTFLNHDATPCYIKV